MSCPGFAESGQLHPDERKQTAAAFVGRGVAWFAQHGVSVEQVMTDNGMCYRSHAFRDVLAGAGIRHLRARPYPPARQDEPDTLT